MAKPHTRCNASGALTNDSGTPEPTPANSWAQILAPTPASAPGLLEKYLDKDLQRTIKLALESFVKSQEYGQL